MSALVLAAGALLTHAPDTVINLHASGTTNPSAYFWDAIERFEAGSSRSISASYRAVGSSTGQKEFVCDPAEAKDPATTKCNFTTALNDFGAGDIPMTKKRFDVLTEHGRSMVHVPFALGAIAVFHSVPEDELGDDLELDLDACLLAKIFSGQITDWEHTDIRKENPTMTAKGKINVVHRTLGSSSTAGFTEYLASKCPASWVRTDGSKYKGSTIDWFPDSEAVQGSGGMSDYIGDTPYAIGYIDSGHGHSRDLLEVKLKNKEGIYLSSLEADIGAAAVVAIANKDLPAVDADWSGVNLYDKPGNSTWPITMVSYFYVDKNMKNKDEETAGLALAFMNWIIGPEGQELAEEYKFDTLPPQIVNLSKSALGMVELPDDAPTFTFEVGTEAQNGQAEYVISSKRKTFAEYEREVIEDRLDLLEKQTNALETHVSQVMPRYSHGSGTTNPSRLFWEAETVIGAATKAVAHVTYRAVGSSTGQKEFLCDPKDVPTGHESPCVGEQAFKALNDFAAGDIPMTKARYDSLLEHGREMVHVPFALGAIAVFHSVPEDELGGDNSLDLDACLLAKIFKGEITQWNHPDILAANPGLTADSKINVVHRTLGSSSTAGFTEYLTSKCPEVWERIDGSKFTGSTIDWFPDSEAVYGSGGMTNYITNTPYAIGYIDSGHGNDNELQEVKLKNQKKFLTSTEAEIGQAAVYADSEFPEPDEDWSGVNLYNKPGPLAWPITMVSYFYLDKDMTQKDPETAALTMAFVEFILSDAGQALAEENLFEKLPDTLKGRSNEALKMIKLPSATPSYMQETGTLIQVGQENYVISGKRRSFAELDRDELIVQMADLGDRVTRAEAAVDADKEEARARAIELLTEAEKTQQAYIATLNSQVLKLRQDFDAQGQLAQGAASTALQSQYNQLLQSYKDLKDDIESKEKYDNMSIAALTLSIIAAIVAVLGLYVILTREVRPITNTGTREVQVVEKGAKAGESSSV